MSHVLDASWGATYDGLIISSALYGIASGQAFRYHATYTDDSPLLKLVVLAIWLISSLQQCLSIHFVWHYIIPRFNPQLANYAVWSLTGQFIPSELVALLSEFFFISKIWYLTHRCKTSLLLLVPAVCAFGFVIVYVATCARHPTFVDQAKYKWLMEVFSITRSVTDIGIAASMSCLAQRENRIENVDHRSNWLIFRILNYLLANGLLTSIITVTCAILYFTMPRNMVSYGIYLVLGRIYFNSMLVSLNNRQPPRKHEGVRFITTSDFT